MTDLTNDSVEASNASERLKLVHVLGPLYARLLSASVTGLKIEYEAIEHRGEVRAVWYNSFGDNVSSKMDGELVKDVTKVVLTLLEIRYGNWSAGFGGYGRLDWDLKRNELIHKHHRRVVTISTTEHRGL